MNPRRENVSISTVVVCKHMRQCYHCRMHSLSLRTFVVLALSALAALGAMLGITKAASIAEKTPQPLLAEADQCTKAEEPDVVFVSCGGFF